MAWYPGMEGGHALARVLAGLVNPSGRLPMTWPAHETELPPFARWTRRIAYGPLHGYRLAEATGRAPAYWFGFGLSYTTFDFGPAVALADGGGLAIEVPVRNTGRRDGATVVQVYAGQRLGSDDAARRTLCAFRRIEIGAGQGEVVRLHLGPDEVRTLGERAAGPLRLWVGPSADPTTLRELTVR
jgi:beta-glucosidase